MKKTFRPKQNIGNKGLSLVEVIVSLLILALIFVPMITAFGMGQRSATKAKELSFAEKVAENCLEEVKALGYDNYMLLHKTEISATDTVTLTGLREGNAGFTAVIKVTASSTGHNSYEYVDLTEFSADKTALVNPNISKLVDYDKKAVARFKEMNEDYFDNIWDEVCKRIEEKNDAMDEAGGGYTHILKPAKVQALSESQIKAKIRREMVIEIKPVTNNGVTTYTVTSSLIYVFDNSLDNSKRNEMVSAYANGDVTDAVAAKYGVICDYKSGSDYDQMSAEEKAVYDKTVSRSYGYYAHNINLGQVDTIYAIYKPLFYENDNAWRFSSDEKVTVKAENLNKDLKCYLVVQVADGTDFSRAGTLKVSKVATGTGRLTVSSQAVLSTSAGDQLPTADSLFSTSEKNVIYDCLVEVFDESGKKITEARSSITK